MKTEFSMRLVLQKICLISCKSSLLVSGWTPAFVLAPYFQDSQWSAELSILCSAPRAHRTTILCYWRELCCKWWSSSISALMYFRTPCDFLLKYRDTTCLLCLIVSGWQISRRREIQSISRVLPLGEFALFIVTIKAISESN
jgi:hypothetical protein